MRDIVYLLVFDGFADHETALALTEIRRGGDFRVRTLATSRAAVESWSGLYVLPDATLAELDPARAALLVVPGGSAWERDQGHGEAMMAALRLVHAAGAPVAGIGTGVLALARTGLLDRRRHTGNHAGYIDARVTAYAGSEQYDATVTAVSDAGVTTASSVGSVEFAREVIRTLDLYDADDTAHWYRLFKHAVPPPWFAAMPKRERAA
jgi:putative intracellular protease/amidase